MTGIEDIPAAHAPSVDRDADERNDDRPEDREDDTDRAIRLARGHVIEAVHVLIDEMQAKEAVTAEERIKAAIALLEVAGCL